MWRESSVALNQSHCAATETNAEALTICLFAFCLTMRARALSPLLGLLLLALRECAASLQALCAMLELDVVNNDEEARMHIIASLQSTAAGRRAHARLAERQNALKELVRCLSFARKFTHTNSLTATKGRPAQADPAV